MCFDSSKHNVPIIYDAAHSFGVEYQGESVFNFGDLSTTSFHATKLFHTGEGGAIFSGNSKIHSVLHYLHNFGHKGKVEFQGLGINGKISEVNAAIGLAIFPHLNEIIENRRQRTEYYVEKLKDLPVYFPVYPDKLKRNYSYFPIILESESAVLHSLKILAEEKIYPRRYFYPSLDTLPYIKHTPMPISRDISRRILCLPLWHSISFECIDKIVELLTSALSRKMSA